MKNSKQPTKIKDLESYITFMWIRDIQFVIQISLHQMQVYFLMFCFKEIQYMLFVTIIAHIILKDIETDMKRNELQAFATLML